MRSPLGSRVGEQLRVRAGFALGFERKLLDTCEGVTTAVVVDSICRHYATTATLDITRIHSRTAPSTKIDRRGRDAELEFNAAHADKWDLFARHPAWMEQEWDGNSSREVFLDFIRWRGGLGIWLDLVK